MNSQTGDHDCERHHKNAYLVLFKHFFFPDVFFQRVHKLRPVFRSLTTPNCLANFVASGHTDLNLNDGRFWLRFGLGSFNKEIANNVHAHGSSLGYKNVEACRELERKVRRARTVKALKRLGSSTEQLFHVVFPGKVIVPSPVVPFIGRVTLLRNALPNCARSETHDVLASLFEAYGPQQKNFFHNWSFGCNSRDQSLSHIPLAIGAGKPVHFRDASTETANRVCPHGMTLATAAKLRVHLCPYGMLTTYLTISVSSPTGFSSDDLIAFLRLLTGKSRHVGDNYCFSTCNQSFRSVHELHEWAASQTQKAIGHEGNKAQTHASDLHSVIYLNSKKNGAQASDLFRELIGILRQDARWPDFSQDFVKSHRSIFGKYVGDYAIPSADSLVLSFGSKWKEYRKQKSRVRFYWGLLSIFEFVLARKFLGTVVAREFSRTPPPAQAEQPRTSDARRVMEWLKDTKIQHQKLHNQRRKFFHDISRVLRLDPVEEELLRLCLECSKAIPTPTKTVNPIHFSDFDGRQFERLVFAYQLSTENWYSLEWYGSGGGDSGRDIWGISSGRGDRMETVCIQCSNRKTTSSSKILQDIQKVLRSKSGRPDRFILISGGTVSAKSRDLTKRYANSHGIKKFEIWSGVEFEERLRRNCGHLLERFVEGVPFPDSPNEIEDFSTRRQR